jgi:predicted dehydrogenase
VCVLLEKPIATSAVAGRALLEAELRSTAFVLPGHVLRFSRDHQRLVEIVRSGQIGEAIYVNSRRYRDDSHAIRYASEDPILLTLIHDIDLARWVAGSDFSSVLARRLSSGPRSRSITVGYAMTLNGVACDLRTSWTFTSGDLPRDRLEVVGERGSVELVVEESLQVHCGGQRIHFLPSEGDDPLSNEHDHFLSRVRNRSLEPTVDLRQAIAGLRLADAMTQSLGTGREVFLSD